MKMAAKGLAIVSLTLLLLVGLVSCSRSNRSHEPAAEQHRANPARRPKDDGATKGRFVTAEPRLGIGPCPVFPADNVFHATVSDLSLRQDSDAVIAAMGGSDLAVRPAFSAGIWEGSRAGIPINTVDSRSSEKVDFVGGTYAYLSDLDGHPIPDEPRFEGWPGIAWDQHLLVVDTATCSSSEFFFVTPPWRSADRRWHAETAVTLDLRSNEPRKSGTATASGTSMLAGMVRYDEVAKGALNHVLGASVPKVKAAPPLWPAMATDGRSAEPDAPAMGTWLRLKGDVDLRELGPQATVIARALQQHGAVILDTNNDGLALTGEPDERWDDDDLSGLRKLTAADFEVVDPSPMKVSDDSFQIR